jgi:conjugal transfer ATP-binding protein TraC
MSFFKKILHTQPPTGFESDEPSGLSIQSIKSPKSSIPKYDAITIDGIAYTKPKKWQFWKKDMAVEETKEYLHFYNQKKAIANEKQLMNSILENNREIVVNDTFARIYNLVELPEVLYYQYTLAILNSGIPHSLSYQIKSTNKSVYIQMLRTRKSILIGKQNERMKRGSDNDPDTDKEINEVEKLIEEMVNDGKKAFLVSLYATITGNTHEELVSNCEEFEDLTNQRDLSFSPRTFNQKQSLPSILPLAKDLGNEKIPLQTDAVVELFPFLARNIQDNSGFYLGVSRTNFNSPIIFDPFKARNANIMILGTSGSGKSVTSKSLLLKLVMKQIQCIILDPEGEYNAITEKCDGQVISFGEQRGLNIFDLEFNSEEARRNHISVLKNFFKFVIDDEKYSDSKLDKILTELYNLNTEYLQTLQTKGLKIGIEVDTKKKTKISKSKVKEVNKVEQTMLPISKLNMSNFIAIAKKHKVPFLEDLEKLTTGSLAGIFDSTERLDLSSSVINFDLSNLGNNSLKLPAMYIIASIVDNLIDRADQKRMIFIDEAHLFLNREFTREFYIRLQKTARKRQAGVVSITQNAEDYREEMGAKTILTQAETVILLKQHTASVNFLMNLKIFDLSEREFNDLYSLEQGQAILFREQEHINIQIKPFENEWEFIST